MRTTASSISVSRVHPSSPGLVGANADAQSAPAVVAGHASTVYAKEASAPHTHRRPSWTTGVGVEPPGAGARFAKAEWERRVAPTRGPSIDQSRSSALADITAAGACGRGDDLLGSI